MRHSTSVCFWNGRIGDLNSLDSLGPGGEVPDTVLERRWATCGPNCVTGIHQGRKAASIIKLDIDKEAGWLPDQSRHAPCAVQNEMNTPPEGESARPLSASQRPHRLVMGCACERLGANRRGSARHEQFKIQPVDLGLFSDRPPARPGRAPQVCERPAPISALAPAALAPISAGLSRNLRR